MKSTSLKSLQSVIALGLLATFSFAILGCGEAKPKGTFSSPSSGDDDGDGVTPGNATGFYVKPLAVDWPVTTLLHKFGNIATPCAVLSSSTGADKDIQCLFNVREGDSFYSDLKWEFNAPPGMCAYILETPSYFYNNRPGVGPATVSVTISGTPATVQSCSAGVTNGTISGGLCSTPEMTVDSTGAFKCTYDYTGSGMANCCDGDVTMSKSDSGGTVVTNTSWGGKIGNCANGVFRLNGWSTSTDGFPMTKVYDGIKGVNKSFVVTKSIENLLYRSNVLGANFYGWTNYLAGTHSVATLPLAMRQTTDLNGTIIGGTNPAYLYECKNESDDTIARVRVYVNAWDTNDGFNNYLAGLSTVGPTVPGTEGTNCNNDGPAGDPCDDFWSWDSGTHLTTYPMFKSN